MVQTGISNLAPGVASAEQVHRTVLTAAQVRALNATARAIIPAPGPNKVIVPGRGILLHLPAGTAFGGIAAGEDLTFQYDGGSVNPWGAVETAGFISVGTAQTRLLLPTLAAAVIPAVNMAVEITNSGAVTGGRSGLTILAYYFVVEL